MVLAALLLCSAAAAATPPFDGPRIAHPALTPDFALRDQNGRLLRLSAQRGKVVMLTFMYTHCPDVCPLSAVHIQEALSRLGPRRTGVTVFAVSVDPHGDTPTAIAHALRRWNLDGPWIVHWLNAPTRAALSRVWRAYGVVVEPRTNDIVHSLALYLIDRNGDERTGYLFPFLQSFVQHDLGRLAA